LVAFAFSAGFQPGVSAQPVRLDHEAVAAHSDRDVTVDVTSANWLDSRVYVVRDGMVTPLGLVSGPGKASFILPTQAATPGARLQLRVEPIGTRASYLSAPFNVDPGDVVELHIENSLGLSNVVIAPRAT
jgi:hypothetical protein